MAELITARNTISGQVRSTRKSIVEHPVLGKNLVEVDDDAKPYVSELFKPRSAEEFTSQHSVLPSAKVKTPAEAPIEKDKK